MVGRIVNYNSSIYCLLSVWGVDAVPDIVHVLFYLFSLQLYGAGAIIILPIHPPVMVLKDIVK